MVQRLDLAEAVARQLVDLIEPLTRFDRSSLHPAAATTEYVAVEAQ